MFIVLLHCTTKDVIPRRGGAPTWESPAIQMLRSIDRGDCHVAWLVPAMLLAMTVVVDGWLRRFEQSDKVKAEICTAVTNRVGPIAYRYPPAGQARVACGGIPTN